MSIRVLIADDHRLFREGIEKLITASPDIDVVGHAENGKEAIEQVKKLSPDVIVLDLNMPDMNGVEVIKALHKESIDVKALVVSMHSNSFYIINTLEAGGLGYLLKDCAYEQLIDAIGVVSQGKKYLCSSVTEILINDYLKRGKDIDHNGESLTKKELDVLKSIALGKSTREISESMVISIKTVNTHKVNILEKLQLKTTADIIKYAIKKGIVSLD